ncbi:MAG: Ig-like domain-containing protein [Steroidobacteraceae bacterium]
MAANGTWSITPTTALANGANAVTVTASDTAGNVSSATTLNLTIESVGPSAPVARLDAASDSGTAGDNITSDTTPTISGTGTAGHTISVSFAGGLTLTTTVAANGTWSVTPATALAGGAQAVSVTATDASGNVSSPTVINLTIDTVAPAAPTAQLAAASDSGTPGDNRTNDSTPTISGTGTAGDRITVTFPTGAALTATVAADGSWSVTPTTAQANGANAILVTATDPAGNVSAATTLNLTIDTTAPAAPTAQLAAASVTWTLGDNRTNDSTPTISGTGTAGDTITVTFPTGPALTTTVAANGSWSVTPATAQAAGAVPVTVTATDAAGNVSTATTLNLTIDTAAVGAPTAQLAASSDSGTLGDNTTSDTTPTISGTGTAGETITVTFPVGAPLTTTVAANGTWSVTPTTAQSAGAVAVQVTATNAAGTVSPATTLNLTIDNVAPAAPVAQLAAASDSGTLGDNRTNDTTPTISGSGTPGDTITVTFPAGGAITTTVAANGSWSATPVTVQTSGAKNISVTATDPAGNVSAATTLTVTIDTTAPSAPTAQLATASDSGTLGDNRTNDTTPTISGTGTAGDTITVNFPTGAPVTTTVAANGSWSVAPASALASGANAISATATDAAGNVSPATTLTVTIDTTPPVAPTLTIPEGPVITSAENANGIQATVTGTFASGETITVNVTRPDATTTSVTHVVTSGEALAGSASVTIPAQSVQGAYSVHATVSDVAGNVSANSPVVAITLDSLALSAPTIAMTEAADGFINDAEAVSGAGSPVVVTLPTGAAANDVVHVTLSRSGGGSTTIDHTVTAGEALAGSLTVTIPTASFTPDGSYSVTATITDSGGNTSAASSAVSFTLDRALPAAVSAPNLTTASDSGSSSTDNITSDTTPTFSGTGAANGATVTLYDTDGTTVLGTGTANGAGSWSVTTTALAAGNHTITARQADAAGNSSAASPSLTVTIDATGPSFGSAVSVNEGFASTTLSPVTLAATDNTTAQASLTVTGASFVSGSGFVAGDVTIGVAGGVATVTRAAGAVDKNGSIVVAVTMTDLAGNATTQNVTINVASVNDAPSGVNATLLTTQNTALVFGTGSFALTDAKDSPANTLASVIIDTLPVAGQLTLNGIAVTIGQEVSAAEIAAGHLVYTPGLNGTGTGYASFTFQVRDNGGTANGGVDLDATPNTITIDVAAALTLGGFGANGGLIGTATTDASGGLLAAGGDGTGVLTLSLDGGALVASVSCGGASGADGAVGAGSALPPLVPVTSLVDPLAAAPGVSGSSLADLH